MHGLTKRVLLTGALLLPAMSGQRMNWLQLSTTGGPTITSGSAMTYDSVRGFTVHFGGWSSAAMSDATWEYDRTWTQRQPATRPPARERAAMCYDSARQRTVLFGGIDTNRQILRDTWEWDGTSWTQRSPSTSPPALTGFAMVYDSARARCVYVGGYGGGVFSTDVWEWDGTSWTHPTPTTRPVGREQHALAYDSARARTVLFGGYTNGPIELNDTWEWNGTVWTQAFPALAPPVRRSHAMVFDSARGRTVVIGGRYGLGTTPIYDTWEWDGSTWTQTGLHARNPGFFSLQAAYDAARERTVQVAGGTTSAKVWEYGDTTFAYATFGAGCAGTNGTPTLALAAGSDPILGQTMNFDVRNLPGSPWPLSGILGVSNTQLQNGAPLPIDLSFLGMTSCQLLVSTEVLVPLFGTNGSAQWSMRLPYEPGLLGATIFLQVITADSGANPLGVTTTNGATVTVGL